MNTRTSRAASTLGFSTLIGGSGSENVTVAVTDDVGNIYLCGETDSRDFPTTSGAYDETFNGGNYDVFVAKLSPDASTLIFSTFVGGSLWDIPKGLIVDDRGDIIVAGYTESTDFPTTPDAMQPTTSGDEYYDLFILKLSPDGSSLKYSTYIEGNRYERLTGLEMTPDGGLVLVGYTASTDFPTTEGAYSEVNQGESDAFVMWLNSSMRSIDACTLVGGSRREYTTCSAVNEDGEVFLGGRTQCYDLPTTLDALDGEMDGFQDGFLIRMSPDGTNLTYSSYIGGRNSVGISGDWADRVQGICLDNRGGVYLTGFTGAADFPVTRGAYDTVSDRMIYSTHRLAGYLMKFDNGGKSLNWSTYVKDPTGDVHLYLEDVCLDEDGSVYITGCTEKPNLQTTNEAYCRTHTRYSDIIVMRFDPSGSNLMYSTYINGTGSERYPGFTLIGPEELLIWGRTRAGQFPTTPGVIDSTMEGDREGIVFTLTKPKTDGYVPSAFTNMGAEAGPGNVNITWQAPEDYGGYPLLGHRIYQGPSIDELEYVTTVVDDDIWFHVASAGPSGKVQYYAVSPLNIIGEGPMSVVSVRCWNAPSQPTDLEAIPGCETVQLEWSPSDPMGFPVLGYHILRGPESWNVSQIAGVRNVTSFVDTNVTNGEKYWYRVRAFHDKAVGQPSDPVNARPVGPPTSARNLKVSPGDTEVNISWSPPISDGGSALTGYNLYKGVRGNPLELIISLGNVTFFVDNDVFNGVEYVYNIRPVNDLGEGVLTENVSVTPSGLPHAPEDVVLVIGNGWIDISWRPPEEKGGMDIETYKVFRGLDSSLLSAIKEVDAASLVYRDDSVEVGLTYFYAVTAKTVTGEGLKSEIVSATSIGSAGPPTEVMAIGEIGQVILTWHPPEHDGGSTIVAYVVKRGEVSDDLRDIKEVVGRLNFVDNLVTHGTTYYYVIIAVNEVGRGTPSATLSATPLPHPTPPDEPFDLLILSRRNQVSLSWTPPLSDGGSPVIGYLVYRSSSPDDMKLLEEIGNITEYVDNDVKPGKTYWYTVVARNDVGKGEQMDAQKVKIPQEEESPMLGGVFVLLAMLVGMAAFMMRRKG